MKTLEEITSEAGRAALDAQQTAVDGIRQRTGTLLAAHALVASFLGATVIRSTGLTVWAWIALASLVAGLIAAAILLAPWDLEFAVDAPGLYSTLYKQAKEEAQAGSFAWLAAAGFGYHALRVQNQDKVASMSRVSAGLALLTVTQTLAWLTGLALE